MTPLPNRLLPARVAPVLVALAALAGAGCFTDDAGGQQGAATFSLRSSYGCASVLDTGCAITRPLMPDIRETVRVELRASGSDDVTLASTAPAVFTVASATRTLTPGRVYMGDLTTVAPGRGFLEVRRGGAAVDRVEVRVAAVATLGLLETDGTRALSTDGTRLALTVRQPVSLVGQPRDAAGTDLFANNGVVWTVPSGGPVRLSWGLERDVTRLQVDRAYVEGIAAGTTTVTVTAGGVTRTLEATVTP